MFDLELFIKSFGYIGLFSIVFAETGLAFGFFLPGDSLLFTAGILASQNFLNIFILCPVLFVAAVSGDSVGYWIGNRFGKRLFKQEDSLFFHKDHLVRAKNFYEKHGGKTVILARFIPLIRTFAPIVAGMGGMNYRKFIVYNIVGGAIWAVGIPLAGYYLGRLIPDIDKYLLPIIALIVIISVVPAVIHIGKDKSKREQMIDSVKAFVFRKK